MCDIVPSTPVTVSVIESSAQVDDNVSCNQADSNKKRKTHIDNERFTFFYKCKNENGFLSNWSPHRISMVFSDGKERTVETSEHALMLEKALLFGDMASAEAIGLQGCKNALRAKKLGRKVVPFDQKKWSDNCEQIMCKILRAKAEQHPETVKKPLLAMLGTVIVETSPLDKIWGIGMGSTNPNAADPSKWKGKNLLGKCWNQVLSDIIKDMSNDVQSTQEHDPIVNAAISTSQKIDDDDQGDACATLKRERDS